MGTTGSAQMGRDRTKGKRWLVLREKNDSCFEIREKGENGGGYSRDKTLPDGRMFLLTCCPEGILLNLHGAVR